MTGKAVQRHRVNRVINFVHANMHDDLDLYCLAEVACLSKYHFVRVFDVQLGQTPLRYLNRVRLERAARQLIFLPNTAIGKIASGCGFASHHSFTRSFSRHFGRTPQDFRDLDSNLIPLMPLSSGDDIYKHKAIRVENRPATRIAYVRQFGRYRRDAGKIRQSSQLIREWAQWRSLESTTPLIGLCPDNRRITAESDCIYDVGISVSKEIGEDDVASILTIPAGRYAIAGVRCRNEQLLSAWDWLCSTWREAQAAPYEQRWNYEVFHYADDGNLSPERGIELCLRLSD